MQDALLRNCLAVIENNPTPDLIDQKIDEKTGKVKWCQLLWLPDDDTMLRVYVYGNERQAVLGHKRRLWVPLESIRIWINLRRAPYYDYVSIGNGGDYCISFDDSSIDGLKEAFIAALAQARSSA